MYPPYRRGIVVLRQVANAVATSSPFLFPFLLVLPILEFFQGGVVHRLQVEFIRLEFKFREIFFFFFNSMNNWNE